MQTTLEPVVEALRRELETDSDGIDVTMVTAIQKVEAAGWTTSWFWRRRLARLERDQSNLKEALERPELLDQAPATSHKLFLFNLARAAGIKVGGLENRTMGEIEERLQRTLGKPKWIWKYRYRFWRVLALPVLGAVVFGLTFLTQFRLEVIVFVRIASAGTALIGVILFGLLIFDRGLR